MCAKKEPKKKTKSQPLPINFDAFDCVRCDLHNLKTNYVLPKGNINGRILLVGEAPGREEDLMGEPFTGKSGDLLRSTINSVGISLDDIFIHNCCMCRPPNNRQPSRCEQEACWPYLLWVMENMPNLKLVILLGATALHAVLKLSRITDKRGSLIQRGDRFFLPAFHPAAILRNPHNKPLFDRDFQFAKDFISDNIKSGIYKTVISAMDFSDLCKGLDSSEVISVDIETTREDEDKFSNFVDDDIIGISFSWKEMEGWYLPFFAEGKELLSPEVKRDRVTKLSTILKSPGKKLILQNGKFDANFLRSKLGLNIYEDYKYNGKIRFPYYADTLLMHHMLDENQPHRLKWLLRAYPDMAFYENELNMYKKEHKITDYGMIPLHIIGKYAAADADGTLRLFNKFSNDLTAEGLNKLFYGLTMPLNAVLAATEYHGVKMDRTKLESMDISLSKRLDDQESKIYKLAGEKFNINSRQQLITILFHKLKLPIPDKRTEKMQISTDAETLKSLKDKHPIMVELLKYYDLKKLHSTYVVKNLNSLDANDRIHTEYKLAGTVTGRLSSRGPNLQNIPASREFRELFIAEEGHSFIISDYSQIELRVMATFSKDPILTRVFTNGEDVHDEVARKILNKAPEDVVSSEERRLAKTINFGLIYGMGATTLAERLNISVDEADRFLATYFNRFKDVAKYQHNIKLFAKRYKYVTTLLGRKRRLNDITSDNRGVRMEAERQALNSGIQGTAGECTNLATVKLHFALKEANISARLVLTVHDELVYEVPNSDIAKASEVIYNVMRKTAEELLGLRVEVDQSVNNRWVELKSIPPSGREDGKEYLEDYLKKLGLPPTLFSDIVDSYNTKNKLERRI